MSRSSASRDDLVAATGAGIDLRTGAEAQVPVHADAHLAQPPAVAGHRDGIAREAGIGLDERLLDLVGLHGQHLLGIVLNRADPSALKRHESYKGYNYDRYFVENPQKADPQKIAAH